MQKIYILSIVLVSLAACNSKTKKKEDKLKKEVLFGTLNDGLYVNPYFNLSIDFDENWEVKAKSFKSIPFGYFSIALFIESTLAPKYFFPHITSFTLPVLM